MNIAAIDTMLELLSPDSMERPWANGPLIFVINRPGVTMMHEGAFPEYDRVTGLLQAVFSRLGAPLPNDDMPENYDRLVEPTVEHPADGILLTVVYAYPVQLKDAEGVVLASAKWVGVQWDRTGGKSNRVLYGEGRFELRGGFYLEGDITDLANAIQNVKPPTLSADSN